MTTRHDIQTTLTRGDAGVQRTVLAAMVRAVTATVRPIDPAEPVGSRA